MVERLLSLPADYWRQFVAAEHEQPNLDHLIIENANCYATPERSTSSLTSCCSAVIIRVWAQLAGRCLMFMVMFVLLQWACWDLWPLQSISSIKPPPPAPCLSAWSRLWHPGKHTSTLFLLHCFHSVVTINELMINCREIDCCVLLIQMFRTAIKKKHFLD